MLSPWEKNTDQLPTRQLFQLLPTKLTESQQHTHSLLRRHSLSILLTSNADFTSCGITLITPPDISASHEQADIL